MARLEAAKAEKAVEAAETTVENTVEVAAPAVENAGETKAAA